MIKQPAQNKDIRKRKTVRIKSWTRWAAPLLVLALAIGAFATLQATKPEPEQSNEGPRAISLFVEEVTQEDMRLVVNTQGEVQPRIEIDLVPQVSGLIVWVSPNFVAGGKVEAGQALIRIEAADYKFAVIRAEARVAEAETQVELKLAAAEIARKNWDDEIVGKPTPLALKLPQLEEARAKLRAAQADLDAARLNLKRTDITVPFSGRVRSKGADLGQYVNVGASLGRVYSTEVAEIRLALTDAQLETLGLSIGFQPAEGSGPVVDFSAIVAGLERHWQGRIVRTEAAIDVSTRVLYAVAEVAAPYGAGADQGVPMAVGLFVEAEIEGEWLEKALVMSRQALRSESTVFVVSDEDTLDIRAVDIVYSDQDKVVLGAGISVGERVVVSPVRAPRQGMKVQAIKRVQEARQMAVISR
jgi:RND family efflux transporter MFP subunit